jgi:hypothetical protein
MTIASGSLIAKNFMGNEVKQKTPSNDLMVVCETNLGLPNCHHFLFRIIGLWLLNDV